MMQVTKVWWDGEKLMAEPIDPAAIYKEPEQPEQPEPVAWKETDEVECPVCEDKGFPWPKCGHITYLERTPPQRTPLTDEQINLLGIRIWVCF